MLKFKKTVFSCTIKLANLLTKIESPRFFTQEIDVQDAIETLGSMNDLINPENKKFIKPLHDLHRKVQLQLLENLKQIFMTKVRLKNYHYSVGKFQRILKFAKK